MGKAIIEKLILNNSLPITKIIWASAGDPISYTFTATQNKTYVAAMVNGDNANGYGNSITTTSTDVYYLKDDANGRSLRAYIINLKAGETISFKISNYSSGAYRGNNAFLAEVSKKIKPVAQVYYNRATDTTISTTQTLYANKIYAIIQLSCGSSRGSSRTINAPNAISAYASDSIY